MLRDKSKTCAESRRYEITGFIEALKDPIHYEIPKRVGHYKILVSAFAESQALNRHAEQMALEKTLNKALRNLSKESMLGFGGIANLHNVTKLVMVFAYEKE